MRISRATLRRGGCAAIAALWLMMAGGCASTTAPSSDGAAAQRAEPADALAERLELMGYRLGDEILSIPHYRLDGWTYLDDMHLIISTGPTRRYLVTLMQHCDGLSTAYAIGFTARTTTLGVADRLLVRDPGNIELNRCGIGGLQVLERVEPVADAS
ncbi:MAG: DUF6491 family protein [Nevskiales bacterium]|nr:DUF6491 family protein [Nevskiales bacterium]